MKWLFCNVAGYFVGQMCAECFHCWLAKIVFNHHQLISINDAVKPCSLCVAPLLSVLQQPGNWRAVPTDYFHGIIVGNSFAFRMEQIATIYQRCTWAICTNPISHWLADRSDSNSRIGSYLNTKAYLIYLFGKFPEYVNNCKWSGHIGRQRTSIGTFNNVFGGTKGCGQLQRSPQWCKRSFQFIRIDATLFRTHCR